MVVDVAGSLCTVCEKQASSMAWQLFLLLSLPLYMLRASTYDTPEQNRHKYKHRGLEQRRGHGFDS